MQSLTRFAWLSIAAAVVTITLKSVAYLLSGSVGLMSDAIESGVNLVAAAAALVALTIAEREPSEEFAFGFEKAEYFSSGFEGALILLAAFGIAVAAVERLIAPQPIGEVRTALVVSASASLINFGVAWRLLRAAREYESITLEADARHLLTDVWTSAGVIVGVGIVALTREPRLDALVALAVAAKIVWAAVGLIRRSVHGLLDRALPSPERAAIQQALDRYVEARPIRWHALRTRQAGRQRFVSVHILVPDDWTVHQGHQLLDRIEREISAIYPRTTMFTQLKSLDDPASYEDIALDRAPLR